MILTNGSDKWFLCGTCSLESAVPDIYRTGTKCQPSAEPVQNLDILLEFVVKLPRIKFRPYEAQMNNLSPQRASNNFQPVMCALTLFLIFTLMPQKCRAQFSSIGNIIHSVKKIKNDFKNKNRTTNIAKSELNIMHAPSITKSGGELTLNSFTYTFYHCQWSGIKTVTCAFTITNNIRARNWACGYKCSVAYNNLGQAVYASFPSVAGGPSAATLPQGVPVSFILTFGNVSSEVNKFLILYINSSQGDIKYRNIQILNNLPTALHSKCSQ